MATWYDEYMVPFKYEFYDASLDPETILDNYVFCKELYKHWVKTKGWNFRVFSNGHRVVLTIGKVRTSFYEDIEKDTIDVRPVQLE
jgi:hypothetical protein